VYFFVFALCYFETEGDFDFDSVPDSVADFPPEQLAATYTYPTTSTPPKSN